MKLWKSHRVFGCEIARAQVGDQELVILGTAPHRHEVSPSHMLMPATEKEVTFNMMVQMIEIIERARFLGISPDSIREVFESALNSNESEGVQP